MKASYSRAGRRVAGIGAAMAVSSLLGFAFLTIASRWLVPAQYALFMAAWGVVFGLATAMLSTEQEVARMATVASLKGERAPVSVVQVAALGAGLATAGLLVVALFPAGRQAMGGSATTALLIWFTIAGFAVQYLSRGVALGAGQTKNYMIMILGDGALRVAAIAVFVLVSIPPSVEFGLVAVAAGCFSWLLVLPSSLKAIAFGQGKVPWKQPTAAIGVLMSGSVLQALLLTAYPALVAALIGVSDELAMFFGVVTLSRIPLVAASPIQTLAVPEATKLIHSGRTQVLVGLLAKLALGTAGAVILSWLFGYFVGPPLVRAFLGPQYLAASGVLVGSTLAAGSVMAVAMLQVSMLVALRRHRLVVLTWSIGLAVAVPLILWWPSDDVTRGAMGFVGGSLAAYVASGLAVGIIARRSGHESAAGGTTVLPMASPL